MADVVEAEPVEQDAPPEKPSRSLWDSWDVALAALAIVAAALAAVYLPDENAFRLLLTLPVLFLAPGYLLLQASVVPAAPVRGRLLHLAFALGASPAVVGLLALAVALVPGAFRPGPLVATVTIGCLALAGIALARRAWHESRVAQRRRISAAAPSP